MSKNEDACASTIAELFLKSDGSRMLVAVVGGPGSGKTTISTSICSRINDMLGSILCHVVPMDGFHYYRHELDTFKDPQLAHKFRGAHYTFNVDKFAKSIDELKYGSSSFLPSFDHALKDPSEDSIFIPESAKIILIEGLYLQLTTVEPWNLIISPKFDFRVFISCSDYVAALRVADRHVKAGLSPNFDEALRRFQSNDWPNGRLVKNEFNFSLPHCIIDNNSFFPEIKLSNSSEEMNIFLNSLKL